MEQHLEMQALEHVEHLWNAAHVTWQKLRSRVEMCIWRKSGDKTQAQLLFPAIKSVQLSSPLRQMVAC